MITKKLIVICWNDKCKYNYVDNPELGTRTCSNESVCIDSLGGCMETDVSQAKWKKVIKE